MRQIARDLAGKPYKAPENKLPDNLKNLNYAQHRSIRFSTDRALWHGEKLPFEAQFFHRGFRYANRVDMYEVKDGHAAKIAYQRDHFSFGDIQPPGPGVDLDFVTNQTGQRRRNRGEIDPHLAIARAKIEEAENYEEAIGYLSEREMLAVAANPRNFGVADAIAPSWLSDQGAKRCQRAPPAICERVRFGPIFEFGESSEG